MGVSESSVKRWCNHGRLANNRTAGGHRRIPTHAFLSFLRQEQFELARPEEIGLPATTGKTPRVLRRAAEHFRQALLAGDEAAARSAVIDLYLAGHRVSAICDSVVAEAFRQIGDGWDCGSVDVYEERRSCELCTRCLHDLRQAITEPVNSPWLAVGGTPEGDPYCLATTMVELVLRESGWRASSLGHSIPLSSLVNAAERMQPRLLWLSVSYIPDEDAFLAEYRRQMERLPSSVALVVGGRALHESLRRQMQFTSHCDDFQHLESFAKALMQPTESPAGAESDG